MVRAPNHLGDVVLSLPALVEDGSDVIVRARLAPILEMAGIGGRVHPLEPGVGGWWKAVARLRRGGFREGVLLTPSFSAAWLFRCGGVRRLTGTDTDARGWLLADGVAREALADRHRVDRYRILLGLDAAGPTPPPEITPPEAPREAWRRRLGDGAPMVGLFPGSNAPARRWPPERFGEVARALMASGYRVVILGGPAERAITAEVAAAAPGALDAGGRTDLPELAALLSLLRLVVTNDTGPMHLAAAVGVPTVSIWGPSDPSETSPVGKGHRRVAASGLPCVPCGKNHCPRSGPGTMLPDAREECMRVVETGWVLATVHEELTGGGS